MLDYENLTQVRSQVLDMVAEFNALAEDVAIIQDAVVPETKTPARIYRPTEHGKHPVVIYIHGGGYVMCNIDTHDNLCRYICNHADAIVVSLGYSLAPECKFPGALNELESAIHWLNNDHQIQAYATGKSVIAGDSAGANMAAALCLKFRDCGQSNLFDGQILVNPVLDLSNFTRDSYLDQKDDVFTKSQMEFFKQSYLTHEDEAFNALASPILASHHNELPQALVLTSELDILRDDGLEYVKLLNQSGVRATNFHMRDCKHGGVEWAVAGPNFQAGRDAVISEIRKIVTD